MCSAAGSWQHHGQSQIAAAADGRYLCGGFWSRRRRLLWLVPLGVLAVAAAVLATLAANYQPLGPGGSGGGSFPGLPTGEGLRWLPGSGDALYVPPQRGTFALAGSVYNDGSWPVTIVAVSQWPGSPFTAAGAAVYVSARDPNPLQPRVRVLRDVTLSPGQTIEVGMPLRTLYCADRRSYMDVPVFLVKERFFVFTRTVAIPLIDYDSPVVTNQPSRQPGAPGTFCGTR